nr:hypothetical protein ISGA_12965 [Gordonia sp. NB41Y]
MVTTSVVVASATWLSEVSTRLVAALLVGSTINGPLVIEPGLLLVIEPGPSIARTRVEICVTDDGW